VNDDPSNGEAPGHARDRVDLAPAKVGIRALARDVSGVVDGVRRSGRAVLITKHGRPQAAIVPIRSGRDMTLASLSNYLVDVVAEELRAGPPRNSREVTDALAHLADAVVRLADALARTAPPTDR
jgi:prevent-host-death family protein